MITIATHPDAHIRPMQIAGDSDEFLLLMCTLSKAIKDRKTSPQDFRIDKPKMFYLDPGGMLNTKEPWLELEIEGITFAMQASKSSYILTNLDKGWDGTEIPGWQRFRNWFFAAAIPNSMFQKIYAWVAEVANSDDALNANLDLELIKDDLVRKNYLKRT